MKNKFCFKNFYTKVTGMAIMNSIDVGDRKLFMSPKSSFFITHRPWPKIPDYSLTVMERGGMYCQCTAKIFIIGVFDAYRLKLT